MNAQKTIGSLLLFSVLLVGNSLCAQIYFKLQLMDEDLTYGVFAKITDGNVPAYASFLGSQITVVSNEELVIQQLESNLCQWDIGNAFSETDESPDKSYLSFYATELEYFAMAENEELLLFTFKLNKCPEEMYILDCGHSNSSDAFCSWDNSLGLNFSTTFTRLIINSTGQGAVYAYAGNYGPFAWDCNDSDGDGLVNAMEDLNGNGIFDIGIDNSDPNDELNSIVNEIKLKVQLMPDGNSWGVYAKSIDKEIPSYSLTFDNLITVVTDNDFFIENIYSHKGLWEILHEINAPVENPDKAYTSFYLIQDEQYTMGAGEDVLLFSFDAFGDCPEEMSILNCHEPNMEYPFCDVNNSHNVSLGTQFVRGILNSTGFPTFHSYSGNYGIYAWDCSDNDGDGFPNAHEDTNGNGIFDGGDVSDLNSFDEYIAEHGLDLKLQLLDDEFTYGVFVKPANYIPDSFTIAVNAQVVLVMPAETYWTNLESINGLWNNYTTFQGPEQNPDKKYVQIQLTQGEPTYPIPFNQGEILLFTFNVFGECPSEMYLMDCSSANASDPFCCPILNSNCSSGNQFSVMEFQSGQSIAYFKFNHNYAPFAWDCKDNDQDGILNALEDTNGNGVFDPFIDASDLNKPNINIPNNEVVADVLTVAPPVELEKNNHFFYKNKEQAFTLSPNPVGDVLFINFKKDTPATFASLIIFDLQGRILKEIKFVDNSPFNIDVADLPAGLYFIALQNDKVISLREKFVKN
ncbi:MAG: T9SS type A sorting domain-containing protein [Bacteroidota bacterium]